MRFEKLLHGGGSFSGGKVFECLPVFRLVEVLASCRENAPAGRIFDLTPKILKEIFENVGAFVDFEERIAILSVGTDSSIFPVLFDLSHGL